MESSEQKGKILQQLRELLRSGDLEKAEAIQLENELGAGQTTMVATTTFQELVGKRKLRLAIDISMKYSLDPEKRNAAIRQEFGRLITDQKFEEAIQWGKENAMASNEYLNAATKLFDQKLKENDAEGAMGIADKYQVPKDMVQTSAQQWFNEAYLRKDFYWAARLGGVYNIAPKRVLMAATKAMIETAREEDWNRVISLQDEFSIFSDDGFKEMREQDRDMLIGLIYTRGLKKLMADDRFILVHTIIDKLELLNVRTKVPEFRRLTKKLYTDLVVIHNRYLERGQCKEAIAWSHQFHLLDKGMPTEAKFSLVRAVQSQHDLLLHKDDYEMAKMIRETYDILRFTLIPEAQQISLEAATAYVKRALDRGDVDQAFHAVEDYHVPMRLYVVDTFNSCLQHLRARNYEKAFVLRDKFKVDPKNREISEEAQKQFELLMKENLLEAAAELGRQFHLDQKKTRQAAMAGWQRLMESKEFEKARGVAKRFRLPAAFTQKTARGIIAELQKNNQQDVADRLRRDYRLQKSLWESVMEFFQRLPLFGNSGNT